MTTISKQAQNIIKIFELEPHIEGGWFRRTFQSDRTYDTIGLSGTRHCTTSIVYLLSKSEFSAFHKLKQYETWHFYAGDQIIIYWFDANGTLQSKILGNNYDKGDVPQLTINPDTYFAAELMECSEYAFVGCSVSPGFDYADFSIASRSELITLYPEHSKIITRLTKK
jgi:predicted cupin superfamily sugar epimerase